MPSGIVIGTGPAALLPKNQVTIPLSPVRPITDTVLFTDPQEASRTYYLPRYRLADEQISGQARFRIQLSRAEQGGVLQVIMESFPAPELGITAGTAQVLPHTLDVRIQYIVPIGNAGRIRKELVAREIEQTSTGLRLTWVAADLNELTQLYQAMTQVGYESILLISRSAEIALPVPSVGEPRAVTASPQFVVGRGLRNALPAAAPLPNPLLQLTGSETYETRGERFRRYYLRVDNWQSYPDELFQPAPDLPPCGTNTNSSRTWLDILDTSGRKFYSHCTMRTAAELQSFSFALPIAQIPPAGVSVLLRDRRLNLTYRSQLVTTQLGDGDHALKVIVPTRNKAATDQHVLTNVQLAHVNPGDRVRLLVEFPDQPLLPRQQATEQGSEQRTQFSIIGAASTDATWMQPVAGQIETESGIGFALDHLRLFGTPAGRIMGLEVRISTPALEQPTRLRSFTITFRLPADILGFPLTPNQVLALTAVRWQGLAAETETFYEVGPPTVVAQEPLPFVFDPALHGYIYRDILVDPGQHFGLAHYQAAWQGQDHFYFQDEAQRDVVYYLPDLFKLTRNRTPPYTPDLLLFFDLTDAGPQATFHYRAVPVVDTARLADAQRQLKPRLRDLPSSVAQITLKPLLFADAIRYKLALPRHSAELGPFQERPQAQVDLRNGIEDVVIISMEDFALVFDSLLTPRASMFNGRVEITLNEMTLPAIPLTAKFYDMVGELLLIQRANQNDEQETVTLHNATESPVRLNWLAAHYLIGAESVNAPITNLTLPTLLEAGGDLQFQLIKPAQLRGGDGTALLNSELRFDLAGVELLPDPEGLWNALIDPVLRPEYRVEVTVRTEADVLSRQQALELMVEFPGRTTVALSLAQLETTAIIYVPVRDYLLKTAEAAIYRYRLQVVHGPEITRQTEWQTFTGSRLRLTDAEFPPRRG